MTEAASTFMPSDEGSLPTNSPTGIRYDPQLHVKVEMLAGVVTCRWSARCPPGTTIENNKQKQISRHCESEPSLAKG